MSFNHTRENHLSGAAFLSQTHAQGGSGGGGGAASVLSSSEGLGRPTALICSSRTTDEDLFGASKWTRRKRDEALLEVIRKVAVGRGKVVLIPADSVARVLELVYLLEHAFRKDRHISGGGDPALGAGLYLAGRKAKRLASVVGSMLEWMDESVIKELESSSTQNQQEESQNQAQNQRARRGGKPDRKGGNQQGGGSQQQQQQKQAAGPFDFLHLKIIDKPAQLEKLLAPFKSTLDQDGDTNVDEKDESWYSASGTDNYFTDTDASVTSMDYDSERRRKTSKRRQKWRQKKKDHREKRQQQKARQKPAQRGLVIIASDTSLEYGFARDAFAKIAGGEGNVVVLTELMDGEEKSTIGEQLAKAWRDGMRERKEQDEGAGEAGDVGVELGWRQIQVPVGAPHFLCNDKD